MTENQRNKRNRCCLRAGCCSRYCKHVAYNIIIILSNSYICNDVTPSNQTTETSSLETITSALVAALTQAGVGCPPTTAPNSTKKRKWRKIQYYCYTHGANASHASKDCKTPLGEHTSKPLASRCDPQGGSTRYIDKWGYWTSRGEVQKNRPN